jgi:hypothetical protein
MTRKRASTLAFATALAASAVSAVLAAPIAHADPLDAIIQTVKKDRPARCPALNYNNGVLEGAAQAYARSENPVDGQPAGYNGRTLAFLGSGDPQAAATTSAYSRGAGGLISNCDFTEFGVGFIRHEDREVDVVTIVFGAPAAAPKPVEKAPDPQPQQEQPPVPCPDDSPVKTVPAGQTCPPPKPVTNAITADFDASGFTTFKVTVKNSSKKPATCNYEADPSGTTRTFDVAANGSDTESFDGLKSGTNYNIKINCTDSSGSQTEPLGSVNKTVKW